jgi:hypothetical protein
MTHAPGGRTPFAVVANLGKAEQVVPLPRPVDGLLLAWDEGGTQVTADGIRMPATSAAVVRLG